MGERKGQNKYYPPDFDYKVHKSLSGYHGEHPLRERARKLDKGILIIRFEMPYNIWCDGCGNHIGMGVRYNAEKSKIGNYYTTPIYQFRMKCHLCPMHFEIKTDPANHDYVITSGARRKEQRWDPKENEQIVPEDRDTQKKLALDSMYKLEHGGEDAKRGAEGKSNIADIAERKAGMLDDHRLNQLARKQFRHEKKSLAAAAHKDDELRARLSLGIDLVAEHEQDAHLAQLLQYSTVETYDEKQRKLRKDLEGRPIFDTPHPTPDSMTSSSSSGSASDVISPDKPSSAKLVCIDKLLTASSSVKNRLRSSAFDVLSVSKPEEKSTAKKSSALGIGIKLQKRVQSMDEMRTSAVSRNVNGAQSVTNSSTFRKRAHNLAELESDPKRSYLAEPEQGDSLEPISACGVKEINNSEVTVINNLYQPIEIGQNVSVSLSADVKTSAEDIRSGKGTDSVEMADSPREAASVIAGESNVVDKDNTQERAPIGSLVFDYNSDSSSEAESN